MKSYFFYCLIEFFFYINVLLLKIWKVFCIMEEFGVIFILIEFVFGNNIF